MSPRRISWTEQAKMSGLFESKTDTYDKPHEFRPGIVENGYQVLAACKLEDCGRGPTDPIHMPPEPPAMQQFRENLQNAGYKNLHSAKDVEQARKTPHHYTYKIGGGPCTECGLMAIDKVHIAADIQVYRVNDASDLEGLGRQIEAEERIAAEPSVSIDCPVCSAARGFHCDKEGLLVGNVHAARIGEYEQRKRLEDFQAAEVAEVREKAERAEQAKLPHDYQIGGSVQNKRVCRLCQIPVGQHPHTHPCVGCKRPVSCNDREHLSTSWRATHNPNNYNLHFVCDRCAGKDEVAQERAAHKEAQRAATAPKAKKPKETGTELDIDCPTCASDAGRAGRKCKRPSGHAIFGGGSHDSRIKAWEKQNGKEDLGESIRNALADATAARREAESIARMLGQPVKRTRETKEENNPYSESDTAKSQTDHTTKSSSNESVIVGRETSLTNSVSNGAEAPCSNMSPSSSSEASASSLEQPPASSSEPPASASLTSGCSPVGPDRSASPLSTPSNMSASPSSRQITEVWGAVSDEGPFWELDIDDLVEFTTIGSTPSEGRVAKLESEVGPGYIQIRVGQNRKQDTIHVHRSRIRPAKHQQANDAAKTVWESAVQTQEKLDALDIGGVRANTRGTSPTEADPDILGQDSKGRNWKVFLNKGTGKYNLCYQSGDEWRLEQYGRSYPTRDEAVEHFTIRWDANFGPPATEPLDPQLEQELAEIDAELAEIDKAEPGADSVALETSGFTF